MQLFFTISLYLKTKLSSFNLIHIFIIVHIYNSTLHYIIHAYTHTHTHTHWRYTLKKSSLIVVHDQKGKPGNALVAQHLGP